MKRRAKVRELMQRGVIGEVIQLFHARRTGIIRSDDGYDVTFNAESLAVGLGYGELASAYESLTGCLSRRERSSHCHQCSAGAESTRGTQTGRVRGTFREAGGSGVM